MSLNDLDVALEVSRNCSMYYTEYVEEIDMYHSTTSNTNSPVIAIRSTCC